MILSLLLAAFLAISPPAAAAESQKIDRLEASVNSSLILLSDIRKFRITLKLRTQLDPLFAGTAIAAKGAAAATSEIVDFLTDEKLIAQAFPITDAEVEQEINSIQANNHIDRASLKSALVQQGFSFEEYFELIRISASKRNLIDRDIRTKVTISDDDVKNFFYNHYSKSTEAPKAFHLEIIAVSLKSYKTAPAAKDVASAALKSIKGGEAFEEVAKRVSDDASAQAGGDLGVLSDELITPVIRAELKKLQIGEVSPVFGGPQAGAYFLVKLVDVKTGDSDRLEKMRDEIRSQLAASEYQHQISLWLERQRQGAFIHRAGEAAIAGLPQSRP